MFEAVVSLCLALEGPCREALLPGYEAAERSTCAAALAARPPDLTVFGPLRSGDPACVPAGAALAVEEIAPGVFLHRGQIAEPDPENRGDVVNLGFIIGAEAVAVIDTGSARWMGEALWRAIRARTGLPVRHVILTHMHPDHVLGAAPFAEAGARIWGHAELARALAERAETYLGNFEREIGAEAFLGTRMVAVDEGVAERAEIDLGGRVLELRAWPLAHTATDLTLRDAQSGLLFAGDLVVDRHAPAIDGSLRGWQEVLAELSALPVTRLVPGHGGPVLGWPEGGTPLRRYLEVLAGETRAALDSGERMGDAIRHVAAGEAAHWALFETYNPRNATVAYSELEWE